MDGGFQAPGMYYAFCSGLGQGLGVGLWMAAISLGAAGGVDTTIAADLATVGGQEMDLLVKVVIPPLTTGKDKEHG